MIARRTLSTLVPALIVLLAFDGILDAAKRGLNLPFDLGIFFDVPTNLFG